MQYLLERLASPPLPALGQFESRDMAALVAAQIQRIVSARALVCGGSVSLLDFGMPHVVEQGLHEEVALQRYAARLVRLIQQYEPRLLHPKAAVRKTGRALMPYELVVSGSLAPEAPPAEFVFEVPTS
ncbi:type VI secretion system baseplate subunit TssE [Pseudoduganella rhizocola]|uniref:type VI secretion system baseplate subunit TssE n=1 Tax=Pseudoduganella rhizocola TaxID=3382643 RepID=UPI0038B468CF